MQNSQQYSSPYHNYTVPCMHQLPEGISDYPSSSRRAIFDDTYPMEPTIDGKLLPKGVQYRGVLTCGKSKMVQRITNIEQMNFYTKVALTK